MIRSLFYAPGKPLPTDLRQVDLENILGRGDGLLWVDFVNEPYETCEPILL